MVKRKPHHPLAQVQSKFGEVATLEITNTAIRSAQALGSALADIVEVVQALVPSDFVKSETAHSPPNSRVWHDSRMGRPATLSEICRRDARRCHIGVVQGGMRVTETRVHSETGQTLRRGSRQQTVRYAIYTREVDVPGWYPEGDGDAIHTGQDLAAFDTAYREMRADYAARIRTIRKRLRLSQEAAGRILGGGKRAFQKYEAGKAAPSDAAIGLIELVGREPANLRFLEQLPGREVSAA